MVCRFKVGLGKKRGGGVFERLGVDTHYATQYMQKTKAKANNTGVRAKLTWITLQCLRIFIFQCLILIK